MNISVIIPAYNEEKYLGQMIDCVLSQTLKPFEVIVVNDGSKDGTQKVIDSYGSRLICLNQENQGLSASRNNAMKIAKGDYIAFLDADDIISSDYLEKLAGAIGDADIVRCSYDDFDDESGKINLTVHADSCRVDFGGGNEYVFLYCAWAALYRKEFLDRYGLGFGVNQQMEDSPFSVIANLLANRVETVEEVLYSHRTHSGTITSNVYSGAKEPKIPYMALREAAEKERQYNSDPVKHRIFEYSFVRILADFTTLRYKTQDSGIRRKLCDYCEKTVSEFFPDVAENPYLKANLSLPFAHKQAVRMFVKAYGRGKLFEFSSRVSAVLRMI